ncbi:MAG: hypothetical protein CVU87_08395 [Firmicutes bacterium HGW-Firmicutes-12]|jgi:uncharacterized protein YjdB|nr:MAG: hypothetical protein CVU87_08395 [Firmicutes bacterium HGW-Firmicutes-12]
MTLEGTTINASGEVFTKDRKNGWVYSYTYTNAGADSEPSTSNPPEAEGPAEAEEPPVGEAIPVETITIEPRLFHLKVGAKRELNVKIKPAGANAADVIVKSYDANVIDINAYAVVTGRNAGYTEIVAATRDGNIQTKSRVFVGAETEVVGLVLSNIWTGHAWLRFGGVVSHFHSHISLKMFIRPLVNTLINIPCSTP